MSTFKRVDVAPEKLEKNEMVIVKPNYQEEIDATRGRRGTGKRTTASSLRDLFMAITNKYDPEINPYKLKLSKYDGIAIENDDDLREVISRIISDNDLPVVEKVIEFHIKNRNPKINFIYYVSSDLSGLGAFIKMGFNQQEADKKVKVKE